MPSMRSSVANSVPKFRLCLMLGGLILGAALLYRFRPIAENIVPTETLVITTTRMSKVTNVAFARDGKTVGLSMQYFSDFRNPSAIHPPIQVFDVASGAERPKLSSPRGTDVVSAPNRQHGSGLRSPTRAPSQTNLEYIFLNRGDSYGGGDSSPDGRLRARCAGNTALVSDATTNHTLRILGDAHTVNRSPVKGTYVACVMFSPDSQSLAVGHSDGTLQVWNVATGKIEKSLSAATGAPTWIAHAIIRARFSPDGHLLAATGGDAIWLYNAQDGQLLYSWPLNDKVRSFGLAFSPDGKTLASGGPHFIAPSPPCCDIHFVTPPPRNTVGEIHLWDTATGQHRATLQARYWIINLTFSPDGKTIASSGDDNTAILWKVPKL